MTTRNPSPQKITILAEIPQVTFPRPGEPATVIALTYQANTAPPRTVWVDESKLPDAIFRRTHPEAAAVPPELIRQGDEARREAIRADIKKRAAVGPSRTLEV